MVRRGVAAAGHIALKEFPVIAILVAIHLATFLSHYNGHEIYPWDFTSSVSHGQTVGWFEDGSILHPPNFLPYSSMGFPGWWAIQSGEWYLPLQALRWLGLKYTFFLASGFQSFHVLMGGIGIYVLSRLSKLGRVESLIAGLVFHFASIFYSNAEHVEFVRAAGLLPWMLIAIHPRVLLRSRLMVIAAALAIQQYLIAAYAGDVVSGFYTAAALVAVWSWEARRQESAGRYLRRACWAGAAGALMAAVKWAIPASQMLGSFVGKPSVEAIRGSHLFTLLFRFGTLNLPGDITMQGLWVPPIAILLLLLLPRVSRVLLIGGGLALGALIVGSLDSTAPILRHVIPGLALSRLAHSDWRVPLQVGLALASGAVVDILLRAKTDLPAIRNAGARDSVIAVLLVTLLAVSNGYKPVDIYFDAGLAVAFIAAARIWLLVRFPAQIIASSVLAALCVIFISATSYLQYEVYVPNFWRLPWSSEVEVTTFGQTISSMIHRPRITAWQRRPARQTFGVADTRSPVGQIDIRMNKAWYAQDFTAFGYDNLGSSQYRDFIKAYDTGPDSASILSFVGHPSQVVIAPASETPDLNVGATCPPERDSCAQGNVEASFAVRQYRLDGATYAVSANQPIRLMENEPFYPGFFAHLCGAAGCQKLLPTEGPADLRVWTLPPGAWTMEIGYRAPWLTTSIIVALAGSALALAAAMPWSRWGRCWPWLRARWRMRSA